MLEIRNVSMSYGPVKVVKDVSFEIKEGEAVALLGGNGAGKTTMLRGISGQIHVSGTMTFMGKSLIGMPPHDIVAAGVVHVPEGRKIFPELTVRENLMVGAHLAREGANQRIDYVVGIFPRLGERFKQRGELLSGGEQQMLAIGRALMSKPKLIMLDEPSLGLAPIIVDRLFDQIMAIKADSTILLVEQNARLALEIADRAMLLSQGKIDFSGTSAELSKSDLIQSSYLGYS
jgi:branched-chain amino acid transport system ATP-binding protein